MKNNSKTKRLLAEFPVPSYEEWLSLVEKQLKGVPFEKKLVQKTTEEILINPLYLKSASGEQLSVQSHPGFFPYTRGCYPQGSAIEGWKISQPFIYPEVKQVNQALSQDTSKGLDAIFLILDAACKEACDPDSADPLLIGRDGISIAHIDDLSEMFADIDLSKKDCLIDAGLAAYGFFSLLIAYLKSVDFPPGDLRGAMMFDPLAISALSGRSPQPLSQVYDEMSVITKWTRQYMPTFRPLGIDARPYCEAGGNAVQELAFAFSAAVEYLKAILDRGLTIDEAAQSMTLFLGIGSDFFTEIAKLRTARTIWAKVVKAFGGSEKTQKLVIHSVSARCNKTNYDPHVNLLRLTTEAYSSILGGCNTLTVAPFDELLGLPTELSRRISRNIQNILKAECHGHRVIDPAGGSWFIEKLTSELGKKVWTRFQEIESQGGYLKSLQKGDPQADIKKTAKLRKEQLATRKRVIVGTNMYPNLDESEHPTMAFNQSDFAKHRRQQYLDLKAKRGNLPCKKSINHLSPTDVDHLDQIIEWSNKGLTLGEINSLKDSVEKGLTLDSGINACRIASNFELLRHKAERYKSKHGDYPKVYLANMGALRQYKARADFSAGFLQPGGFKTIHSEGFNRTEDAVASAVMSKAKIVVICSTDESYPEIVPQFTKLIKREGNDTCLVLAGYPKDDVETYRQAGIDEFIHLKANNLQLLQKLQDRAGV